MTVINILSRVVARLGRAASKRLPGRRRTAIQEEWSPDEDDIEVMFNAHISSHLAALPRAYLDLVPAELADLIRQAKSFHDDMDECGAEDESELAEAEIGVSPRHHIKLRLGPNAGQYMAIPTAMHCEYAGSAEALNERASIRRVGGVVIDVFGNCVERYAEKPTD